MAQNLHHGAFQQNRDFSLIRHFKLSERQDLRFTADFFNPWNQANFGSPHVTDYEQHLLRAGRPQTSPNPFGEIVNTAGTPRRIQFSPYWAF